MTTLDIILYSVSSALLIGIVVFVVCKMKSSERTMEKLCPGDRVVLVPWWRAERCIGISKHVWEYLRRNGYMVVISVSADQFTAAFEPTKAGLEHNDCMDELYLLDAHAVERIVKNERT